MTDPVLVGEDLSMSALWQPVTLGGIEIKNRLLMSAHGTQYMRDTGGGLIADRYMAYLERRAQGGVGMIVTGASPVDPRIAGASSIHLFDERNIALSRELTRRVHRHGSKLFAQIFHPGFQTDNSDGLDWNAPVSASALASPAVARTAHELTVDEIAEIVECFGRAAANARVGGFDGVELSAGHGYLVCQFLSPLTNLRTDEYGGSIGNRLRIVRQIAEAVRRHAGTDFPLGIRMSYDEHLGAAGITPDLSDEFLRRIVASRLYDYVSVSGGSYHTLPFLVPPSSSGLSAPRVPHAARAKAIVGDSMPVIASGLIRSAEAAAAVIASGAADMVAMARALIADPDLVRKSQAGRSAEVRHCIGSNNCWRRAVAGKHVTCSVNPRVGREGEWTDGDTVASRSVVVVGAGPAGLKAAVVAAERGHRVTLLERAYEVGGTFRYMRVLPGRERWYTLVADLSSAAERLGVDVQLGVDATPELISALSPDHVIIATGAVFDRSGMSAFVPTQTRGIPGASRDTVTDPIAVLDGTVELGERVVIVEDAGNYVALGIAVLLAERGHAVEIVTPRPHVGVTLYGANEAPFVMGRAARAGVRFTTSSFVTELSPGAATISSLLGGPDRRVEVDSVVVALMRLQNDSLSRALRAAGVPAVDVGDCLSPGEVDEATHEGERAARLIV